VAVECNLSVHIFKKCFNSLENYTLIRDFDDSEHCNDLTVNNGKLQITIDKQNDRQTTTVRLLK